MVRVDVDVHGPTTALEPYWKRSFGSGHAALGLRDDWQAALARGAEAYGLAGIRQHGIFDDDMGVVSLDAAGEPVYNFTNIDVLWDAHVRNGVAPLVELSFMPLALANCSSAARPSSLPACVPNGWVRTGVPFPPRRWDDWRDLVAATAAHAVDRYGLEEVQTWRWEVWNELWGVPGASETALGNYTRTFYAASAEAIKGVDATLRVGGPASAGAVVLPAFIEEVEALGLPLDFVSSHYYGNAREFYWNPDCFAKGLVAWAKSFVPDKYPFYVTEYNVAVGENDVAHDTSTAAAFLWRTIGALDGVADVLSWWAFSDIFEEAGLPTTEFAGSTVGLETISGIAKPAFRAFQLLHEHAGPHRVAATVAVFLSNWDARLPPQGWSDAPAPTTAVTVAGVSGDLELYRIDEEHANPRARWLAMGAPAVPSTSQLAELRDASRVAAEVVTLDAGAVALEMPANAAYLLVGAAA
ncbi:hypothetical protein AURANDRAFT_23523 [Aureococcus anophagefferens]|uniref:Glycosyl hydrolases family 39 N-terminal catalytic domain-containing protein n=1 Tax=Aureococcus anophagefferens TaxID=44056 RepID=F0Y2Z8_AURAN|nr:hypothetical protein AURANDRAFT_23523 [Aureococcus anophagefferens]EGB10173.1 hypothetical protein AURANDRAFT_23523 [Aureococcus anophagefferens]|eukprot:XP_009034997.1 hypothetical protein AURANDRAFT_23523 [Aureococcus anophagefferens]